MVLLAKAPVTIATWRSLQDLQAVDFLQPENQGKAGFSDEYVKHVFVWFHELGCCSAFEC